MKIDVVLAWGLDGMGWDGSAWDGSAGVVRIPAL